MKEIHLSQGYVAFVDDEDYERVSQLKWTAVIHRTTNSFRVYAHHNETKNNDTGKRRKIYLHRFILGSDCPGKVDHQDTNGLNNQRYNLRPATSAQNLANQNKTRGTSKWKGVSWCNRTKKWVAQIAGVGKHEFLGRFNDEVDAATAYNLKAFELFGEFSRFNIPERA